MERILCHKNGNLNEFIEFMIIAIDETLDNILWSIGEKSKNISTYINKLLYLMEISILYSVNKLMNRIGIKTKETLRTSYLNLLTMNGFVTMTM